MFEARILPSRIVPVFKPRFYRIMKTAKAYSMVSKKRMQILWGLMFRVERDEIAGDYVELGTARGGTAITLCSHAQRSKFNRQIWLFDAFEDFSPPVSTYREVSNLLYKQLHFDPNKVHIIKGYFSNTLSQRPALPVALLHIDASGYETVKVGLDRLYSLVTAGGWLVFDNYLIDEGVRRAVDELLETCNLTGRLEGKSNNQVYFQKPRNPKQLSQT